MKTYSKVLIAVNVLLLIILTWVSVREKYPQRAYNALFIVKDQDRITYDFNRDELFEALPKDSNAIIFMGNSLTSGFELAELFHSADIKNRGIRGDFTKGLLNRLNPIVACRAKKIFIEIGINDVLMQTNKDTILKNYTYILETLKKECPRSEVYIQSILPVSNNTLLIRTFDPVKVNEKVKLINDQLRAYAEKNRIGYIDLCGRFVIDNGLNPKYTIDGVHLNGAGYLLWTDMLKPYVNGVK